ncbi:hypothetical protein ACFQHO_50475 [Actinomadura yumaensis]|uniref:hypothetical protein n=1 Tax=Actinomadura yumaensis TaxID=111807 RepID=UPI00362234E7
MDGVEVPFGFGVGGGPRLGDGFERGWPEAGDVQFGALGLFPFLIVGVVCLEVAFLGDGERAPVAEQLEVVAAWGMSNTPGSAPAAAAIKPRVPSPLISKWSVAATSGRSSLS